MPKAKPFTDHTHKTNITLVSLLKILTKMELFPSEKVKLSERQSRG